VADLVNIGAGRAGTCTAAYFLTRFVDKVPYLHLDVAGTGGPGKEAWGVRTLRALVNP
jgi:leucyl aminopeptidase